MAKNRIDHWNFTGQERFPVCGTTALKSCEVQGHSSDAPGSFKHNRLDNLYQDLMNAIHI